MSQPTPAETPQPDADGYLPATTALACPYDGGELTPILEYVPGSFSEHRDFAGTECDRCLAEWNKDGSPRRGPHSATIAYEKRVAQYAPTLDPTQQAQDKA